MFQSQGGGYRIVNPAGLHFVTCTIVDWVDLFTRTSYCDILIDNFRFYGEQCQLEVYGYVIMSNHLHALLRQPEGRWTLSDTLRDFKKMTARQIMMRIATEPESRREWISHRFEWNAQQRNNRGAHQVWTDDNHPEEIWSRKFFEQKLYYIHMNPVRAGLVHQPEHWRYSSASDMLSHAPLLKLHYWD
jgi:REP element-mobilizing transposase RayT